jgi:hypothetical protein
MAGDGGGLSVQVSDDVQVDDTCTGPPFDGAYAYWNFVHSTSITVSNSTFHGNAATSVRSSGGGLHVASGGLLAIRNSTLSDNYAGLFGGGVSLGTGDSSDTCALQLREGVALVNNVARHGGSQVSMGCAADMLLYGSNMKLTVNSTQVLPKYYCLASLTPIVSTTHRQALVGWLNSCVVAGHCPSSGEDWV